MSRGHRKDGTPEKEVEEAADRMEKYPEHLKSARKSDTWNNFLINIGVKEDIVKSKSGNDFWARVRNKIEDRQVPIKPAVSRREFLAILTLAGITEEVVMSRYNKPQIIHRGAGGRFVSVKSYQ